jgi:SHS2 domain-containing protein
MKPYKILEHKADLKIRSFGKTKEELFSNTLKGMSDSQRPEIEEGTTLKRGLRVISSDLSALLVDFLSEILYLEQTKKEIYFGIEFKKFTEKEIEAEISGQKVTRFNEDIKAVTYHEIDVRQKDDGDWEATIIFDI